MVHNNAKPHAMKQRPKQLKDKLKTKTAGNISKELSQVANGVFFSERKHVFDELKELGQTLKAVRTWEGAPVPGTGAVHAINLVDDTATYFQPSAGQCIRVNSIAISNQSPDTVTTYTISLTDGTNEQILATAEIAANTSTVLASAAFSPIDLTNTLYLKCVQTASLPFSLRFGFIYTVYDGGSDPS